MSIHRENPSECKAAPRNTFDAIPFPLAVSYTVLTKSEFDSEHCIDALSQQSADMDNGPDNTPPKRTVSKEHFFSSTPAVHIPDPAVVVAKGIDRPPTPIPALNLTPPKQSYANLSNHQLEAAYLRSPKLPPPNPLDPIFSSPSNSIEEVIEDSLTDDESLPSSTTLRGDNFDNHSLPSSTTFEDGEETMPPNQPNNQQASGQPVPPNLRPGTLQTAHRLRISGVRSEAKYQQGS
jgi:hypothetical protein